jgi:CRISPR-associated protein Cas1
VPLHNLNGIVCMGWDISCSTSLMAACAEAKISLSFHNPYGKFLAAVNGFTAGNILLRREQYRRADHEPASVAIAANLIAAKLHNTRQVLLRAARDHGEKTPTKAAALLMASDTIAQRMTLVPRATSLDSLRGIEGDAAALYFDVFPHLFTNHDPRITFDGRNRRPPLDPVNALLSFLYVC